MVNTKIEVVMVDDMNVELTDVGQVTTDAGPIVSRNSHSMPIPTRVLRASWSSTLQLPKSAFPPRAVIADRPKYLKRCTDDLYAWQRHATNLNPHGPTFTLHDGPPYANGSLHIGHALNKILKDITCRFQLLQGNRVEYTPGWDCHGLPIELKALQRQKELGYAAEDKVLGALAVRNIARELALTAVEEQKQEFRGWGIMADWDHAWKTMDKAFELKQLNVFKRMVQRGLVYRRFKPVYWSPSSHTALAEGELEYNPDHVSTAAFIKFPIEALPPNLVARLGMTGKELAALIWTTTPWTLPANKAIAVRSDLEYVIVESAAHGPMFVAKARVEEVEKLSSEQLPLSKLGTIRGSELVGALYHNPALGDNSPPQQILHADFVSADSGSGLVHVAPGHGMDDYKLGQEHGINPFAPVDEYGRFTIDAQPESLVGKDVLTDGNNAVLDELRQRRVVLVSYKHRHSYPYDWRSKQPIITRATAQWFANVGEIRERALQALDKVTFIPHGGKERLSSFVRNRSEWCISRQRAWGVPIPALYHKDTGEAFLTSESVSHIISVIQKRGIDAWWTDEDSEAAWIPSSLENGPSYRRGKDTMDVWFDSGTSWTQMKGNGVADVYLEGTDQHRGWFQSSLLTMIAFETASDGLAQPEAPYKTLVTHGFILDQYGKKMSKSEGNVIAPDQIMDGTLLSPIKRKGMKRDGASSQTLIYDAMGPDALRLWVAGCDYTKDVIIGPLVLKAVNNSLSKLRITFKLLLGLLDKHQATVHLKFNELSPIDQIALIHVQKVHRSVQGFYKNHEYHKAINAINQYISTQFSALYIESIKDRMYADPVTSPRRKQAQMVLWEIFKYLSTMLAPITPLLVEEACDQLPEDLVFHPVRQAWRDQAENFSGVSGPWTNPSLERDWEYLLAVNTAVKSAQELARGDKKMGSSLQSFVMLEVKEQVVEPSFRALLHHHLNTLEDLLVVSDVQVSSYPLPLASIDPEAAWSYSAECIVHGQKVVAYVRSPTKEKCGRCWRYAVDPGTTQRMNVEPADALCPRCDEVVNGLGG